AGRLVADLGNEQFAVRNAATLELKRLGEAAKPALTQAIAGKPPLEMQRRIEQLLAQLEGPERLRAMRALAALERIATQDAIQVLEKLAGGAAEASLTREARASLERLARRK